MTKSLKQIAKSPGKTDLAASQQLSRSQVNLKSESMNVNSDAFEYRLTTKYRTPSHL